MSESESGTRPRQQQLALTRAEVRKARAASPRARPAAVPAARLPVARVLVDVGLAHLDRPFDYAVSEDQSDEARPGARVKVRFAGKDVAGFVLERVESSEHIGRLAPLRRVVSPMPVLTAPVARLCRDVADRYAGVVSDVLRLAVPPRHARVEKEFLGEPASTPPAQTAPTPRAESADARHPSARAEIAEVGRAWAPYPAGGAFLDRLRLGLAPRAVWTALPGPHWVEAIGDAVLATLVGGRGSVVCLPDQRDVVRLADALRSRLGDAADEVAVVTADLGPSARYRAFLRVLTGASRIVVGTRSAAFAPVHGPGLLAVWDDGDDLHAEPRAPYPHVREVLAMRAELQGCGLLVGGFARTAEGQHLVESGWA
ncbi:MAG TPA: primosome assembly protein PriA, partial [Nocardioidaceae bacterium]|nr:primosome assembly protein PriA [Nocardioidaceae bacterium]